MVNNQTTHQLIDAAEHARQRAQRAMDEFDRASLRIEEKSRQSIDLFGDSAVSQVADIATAARKACNELYTSLQSLVVTLDEQCRPLLQKNPSAGAVRSVAEILAWLNDESEIEDNYSASLNDHNLGQFMSGRYEPTMEAKMIQKYWEDRYESWPDREEQEAQEQADDTSPQTQRRKKQQLEEEEYQQALARYTQELKEWEDACNQIPVQIQEKCDERFEKSERDALNNLNWERESALNEVRQKIKENKDSLAQMQAELSGLGFFAFAKKSQLKQDILAAQALSEKLERDLNQIKRQYKEKGKEVLAALNEQRKNYNNQLWKKYKYPPKPLRPVRKNLQEVLGIANTPTGKQNTEYLHAILAHMEPDRLYDASDILAECPEVQDLSEAKINALLRLLTPRFLVAITEKNQTYFGLSDDDQ